MILLRGGWLRGPRTTQSGVNRINRTSAGEHDLEDRPLLAPNVTPFNYSLPAHAIQVLGLPGRELRVAAGPRQRGAMHPHGPGLGAVSCGDRVWEVAPVGHSRA